jgi:predicted AlkP superfamily pyrophosphatase or phosphodiesterase
MTTTLPAKPKAFGNLRHVFKSSLAAAGFGTENPLGFKRAKAVTVVFIDGLGSHQIRQRAGHSPWLASQQGSGYSVFPSTTAAGITSFATGMWPGQHGIVGHQAYDRFLGQGGNMLTGWNADLLAREWQSQPPLSQLATEAGVSVRVIAHSEYQTTGFTEITMRGAEFVAADDISDRFDRALSLSDHGVNYLYIAELDKVAHRYGWQSRQWVEAYERVATEAERFVRARGEMAVVVTADHGLIDTESDRRFFLDEALQSFELEFFGGDTRAAYLYVKSAKLEHIEQALSGYSFALSVHSLDELVSAGWLGPVEAPAMQRLPDFILLAKSNYTLFHSAFSKPKSAEMVAHHGGLTPEETQVPLLRFGL